MKTYELNAWGKTYRVELGLAKYCSNDNLAISLTDADTKEPFATLTVNLMDSLPEDEAYVDVNNCPWAEEFIQKNELGFSLFRNGLSGFCSYPLYIFSMDALKA